MEGRTWRCNPCDKDFISEQGYREHYRYSKVHRKTLVPMSRRPKPAQDSGLFCAQCNKSFVNQNGLQNHLDNSSVHQGPSTSANTRRDRAPREARMQAFASPGKAGDPGSATAAAARSSGYPLVNGATSRDVTEGVPVDGHGSRSHRDHNDSLSYRSPSKGKTQQQQQPVNRATLSDNHDTFNSKIRQSDYACGRCSKAFSYKIDRWHHMQKEHPGITSAPAPANDRPSWDDTPAWGNANGSWEGGWGTTNGAVADAWAPAPARADPWRSTSTPGRSAWPDGWPEPSHNNASEMAKRAVQDIVSSMSSSTTTRGAKGRSESGSNSVSTNYRGEHKGAAEVEAKIEPATPNELHDAKESDLLVFTAPGSAIVDEDDQATAGASPVEHGRGEMQRGVNGESWAPSVPKEGARSSLDGMPNIGMAPLSPTKKSHSTTTTRAESITTTNDIDARTPRPPVSSLPTPPPQGSLAALEPGKSGQIDEVLDQLKQLRMSVAVVEQEITTRRGGRTEGEEAYARGRETGVQSVLRDYVQLTPSQFAKKYAGYWRNETLFR